MLPNINMSDQNPAAVISLSDALLHPLTKCMSPRADSVSYPEVSYASLDSDDYFRSNRGPANVGHFFDRKLFKKQTYCHHCTETIGGLLANANGFICQVCNFVCHDRCKSHVSIPCIAVAITLIKRPVAHVWSNPIRSSKRRFCNVCRERIDDCFALNCETTRDGSRDLAVIDCKDGATFTPSSTTNQTNFHHWREGDLSSCAKCIYCRKFCSSTECLAGLRCEWCGITVHAECKRIMRKSGDAHTKCDFGILRKILIPPSAISLPRIALSRESIFSINENRGIVSLDCFSSMDMLSPQIDNPQNRLKTSGNSQKYFDCDEDTECVVSIYDGNRTIRYGTPRSLRVPKNTSYDELLKYTMRAFLINDDYSNYFLVIVDEEERFSCNICQYSIDIQKFNRDLHSKQFEWRLQQSLAPAARLIEQSAIMLRAREDLEPFRSTIRIYSGILKDCQYCILSCTAKMAVEEIILMALKEFKIDGLISSSDLSIVDSCYEGELNDIVLYDDQFPLLVMREKRKESLLMYNRSRFCLQYKDDPHGSCVRLFVGNLPESLSQRKYEQLVADILSINCKAQPFNLDAIYYEYGAVVLVFPNGREASQAYRAFKSSTIDEQRFSLMIIPKIEIQHLSNDTIPLLIFVNTKSGGQQGIRLISRFRQLVNPHQVFDLENGGPLPGLYVFRSVPSYRILICGGDGTIGWVLSCLDNVRQDSVCQSPPIAILPLGTGNDLARVLRWGSGYDGAQNAFSILQDTINAEEVKLDRWTVVMQPLDNDSEYVNNLDPEESVEKSRVFVMNNYFSIGVDAGICLDFHTARQDNPSKFSSRFQAKGYYFKMGLREMVVGRRSVKDFYKEIDIHVDGKCINLPPVEGLIVLNILSGSNPWGTDKDYRFSEPNHFDGVLEVIGLTGVIHLGQIKSGIRSGIRIAQGGRINITLKTTIAVQVDGEPWLQQPCQISITKSALKANMLRKQKDKIKRRNTDPDRHRPSGNATLALEL